MRFVKRLLLALLVLTTCSLSACESPLYNQTNKSVMDTQGQINIAKKRYSAPPAPVVNNSGMYVNTTPVVIDRTQAWMTQRVDIHAANLPLNFYVSKVLAGTNATASYASDISSSHLVSLNYSGTIKGALDILATKTGYSYSVDGSSVMWSNMITKTFDISFMPGSSQYLVGGQGAGNTTPSTGNATYFGGTGSANNQYSSLKGNLSVWNDLRETLNKLKSRTGQIVVSEATTTVTIYDHPENVAMMAEYLKYLNKELSHQVALDVKVLEIDLNKNFNYGVDWKVAYQTMGAQFGMSGQMSQPVRVIPLGSNTSLISGPFLNGIAGSRWDGTQVLINALKQQGRVSVDTEPRVVTMNNQVAEIGINTLTGYLQQVSTTVTSGIGGFATTSLTPGVVKSGFTLYVLPKIDGKNVYLQLTSNIANLLNIQSISSCTDVKSCSANAASASIQVPTVTEKTFNERSSVPSGDTLIIAGFKQLRNEANKDQTFNATTSKGVSRNNTETIILITPTILN